MAALSFHWSLIISIVVVVVVEFDTISFSKSEPLSELVTRLCREDKVGDEATYLKNYDRILDTMDRQMAMEGYGTGQMGKPPERLYVFSQCMGDLNGGECMACYNGIKQLMSSCFPATGGRVFYNGCFIRAENYNFFNHTVEPDDIKRCSDGMDPRQEFVETGRKEIKDLVKVTAENGGFGMVNKKTSDVSFYGMAMCWKTLSTKMCKACLENAANTSSACLPSTEGRVLNSGCSFRYADYDFGNKPNVRRTKELFLTITTYVLVALAISLFVVMVSIYVGKAVYNLRSKSKSKGARMEYLPPSKKGMNFLEFNYSTLQKATEHFNDAHKLGQGGFGEVFKGTLHDGREIAIKRLFASGKNQTQEIYNEIDIISSAQHKNLVRFLGCCFTDTNSYLVYEFLVNKSLDRIIFGKPYIW
ncbi:Tyrosine-protein kinase [Parasponia andersonii]|uniref:Tyrosine-protein kinase n=1 Tax=Parasponia andersonii TaxID=3476 RepID=A0A2P5BUL7_PARAD|nr:Tyrosine-protein kinase [Parasponia andersonii]